MGTRVKRSWLLPLIVLLAGVTALALAKGGSASNGGSKPTVSVKKEQVEGQKTKQQVLVDQKGMTLYYSTKDTPKKSACTGACAQTWKPLTVSGKPTADNKQLQANLSTIKSQSGKNQVEFKGHPLYTYTRDQNPGDASGNGLASFKVATMSIKAAGGSGSGSSSKGAGSSGTSGGGSSKSG